MSHDKDYPWADVNAVVNFRGPWNARNLSLQGRVGSLCAVPADTTVFTLRMRSYFAASLCVESLITVFQ
jgi:hypothetical protein